MAAESPSHKPDQPNPWVASIGLWLGLVLFVIFFLVPPAEEGRELPTAARDVAAVTMLCATWWITQAIPIPATSLLPLVLFPALGVLDAGATAKGYMNDLIILMMGGFFLSQAIQKWGLHRRIALHVIAALGRRPELVILGFMLATALLSMWIANTATTLMLLPVGVAILAQVRRANPGREGATSAFGLCLMLGIAYSASVGGLGTPVGTPPNLIFMQHLSSNFPDAPVITFPQWMAYTLPLVAIFLPVIWFLLTRLLAPIPKDLSLGDRDLIADEIRQLGPMSTAEKRVLILFGVTALLWIFLKDVRLRVDAAPIPGIATLLAWWKIIPEHAAEARFIGNGTVAILMTILFFVIRSGDEKSEPLLDWKTASSIPWGLLLLFGGGLTLAQGFAETGLSEWLGQRLAFLEDVPTVVLIATVCLLITFMTEITSNTATASVMMPILIALADGVHVNPILLMMPAAITASFSFMMPVGTGPNAVVFSSGEVPIARMARAGLVLNLVGVALVTAYVYLVLVGLAGMPVEPPEWAR